MMVIYIPVELHWFQWDFSRHVSADFSDALLKLKEIRRVNDGVFLIISRDKKKKVYILKHTKTMTENEDVFDDYTS